MPDSMLGREATEKWVKVWWKENCCVPQCVKMLQLIALINEVTWLGSCLGATGKQTTIHDWHTTYCMCLQDWPSCFNMFHSPALKPAQGIWLHIGIYGCSVLWTHRLHHGLQLYCILWFLLNVMANSFVIEHCQINCYKAVSLGKWM